MFLKKFGIGVKWVNTDDPEEFRKAVDEKTKAIYIESIGNPKYNVPNMAEIAKVGDLPGTVLSESRLTGGVLGRSRSGNSLDRRQHLRNRW